MLWPADRLTSFASFVKVVIGLLHKLCTFLFFFAAYDNNNDNNNICNDNIIYNDNQYDANDADDSVVVVR